MDRRGIAGITQPRIRLRPWFAAYVLQRFAPLLWRPRRELFFAQRAVAPPQLQRVSTRHGTVRCWIYRPPADAPAPPPGRRPPVYVQFHGGGFYGRYPSQDEHVATYIASDIGAYVVAVDYDVAPQVRYPVAEEECFDVVAWVHGAGPANGWDAGCIAVGGFSAGGKLAINVCQSAHAAGTFRPCALVTAYAVADITRSDRTSAKRHPGVSPRLQRLVNETYFVDAARRSEALASPALDDRLADALPCTLILTGADDTLAPHMDALAERLAASGVAITHRRFAGIDHGFTHNRPVATAREAIALIGEHLQSAFARCTPEGVQ